MKKNKTEIEQLIIDIEESFEELEVLKKDFDMEDNIGECETCDNVGSRNQYNLCWEACGICHECGTKSYERSDEDPMTCEECQAKLYQGDLDLD